jgi:hypothetical protein
LEIYCEAELSGVGGDEYEKRVCWFNKLFIHIITSNGASSGGLIATNIDARNKVAIKKIILR